MKKVCEWTFQDSDCYYDSDCGEGWCFEVGDLKENKVKFCPFCGKKVKEVKP